MRAVATWLAESELRTVISAPEIPVPGLGPPAPCTTVPEIAPDCVMFTVLVAESLAELGSGVSVLMEAVLLTDPLACVTLTTSAKVTVAPFARVPSAQSIEPVPFTAGVAQAAFEVRLWKVVPAGTVSDSNTLIAGSGPAL